MLTTTKHQHALRQVIASSSKESSTRQQRTILLVDDELEVQQMTQIVLEKAHYNVLTAASGQQALEIFAALVSPQDFSQPGTPSTPIDVAIVDLSLPDMHGLDLAAQLRAQLPSLPIIAISGYSQNDFDQHNRRSAVDVFLEKPFRVAKLKDAINNLLEIEVAKQDL